MNFFLKNDNYFNRTLGLLTVILVFIVLYWDFYYTNISYEDLFSFPYLRSLFFCINFELLKFMYFFFDDLSYLTWFTDTVFYFIDILFIFFLVYVINILLNSIMALNEVFFSKLNNLFPKLKFLKFFKNK